MKKAVESERQGNTTATPGGRGKHTPPAPSKSAMPIKSTDAIVDLASADSDSALSDISD